MGYEVAVVVAPKGNKPKWDEGSCKWATGVEIAWFGSIMAAVVGHDDVLATHAFRDAAIEKANREVKSTAKDVEELQALFGKIAVTDDDSYELAASVLGEIRRAQEDADATAWLRDRLEAIFVAVDPDVADLWFMPSY